jgi:hypothetical protein
MVVNSAGQLVGTITDGDIRRALLRGLSVADSVDEIVMRQALVVPPERWPEAVVELMRTNRIHELPVVDEQRRVTGLHLWDEFIGSFERAKLMVIMAVGLGTRLVRPVGSNFCRSPASRYPSTSSSAQKKEGFSRFVLAVRYLGLMIKFKNSDGSHWGVRIDDLREDDHWVLLVSSAYWRCVPRWTLSCSMATC